MMAAFAEGLALTGELGLSRQDMLDVVALGAIASPMFALKVGGCLQTLV
jgi:glyoxylate/succinic semialdehyde reductase